VGGVGIFDGWGELGGGGGGGWGGGGLRRWMACRSG